MGPEMKITAQLAGGRLPVKSAAKLGIHARKYSIIILIAVQGNFKIRPDQRFPDVEFLYGGFQGFLIGSIGQGIEPMDGYRKYDAEYNQNRHHFKQGEAALVPEIRSIPLQLCSHG